jgi:hypothetical protein
MVFTTCSLAKALDVILQKFNQRNFKNQGHTKKKINALSQTHEQAKVSKISKNLN